MYTMIPFHGRMRHAGDSALDDRFFRSLFDMSDWMGSAGFRVDIRENDASYLLEAELPGVDEKDIDLTVEDHEMTINANLNAERQDDRNCYSERRCGHVSRTFSLEATSSPATKTAFSTSPCPSSIPRKRQTPAVSASTPTADSASITTKFSNYPET